jgi:cobalt/nickel transport system permease protein
MSEQSFTGHAGHGHRQGGLLERIAGELFEAMEHALHSEELATQKGVLQRLDPRVKLIGLLALIVAAVGSRTLPVVYGLLAVAILLAVSSRVSVRKTMLRVWLSVLFFTGVLSIPALFLVHGDTAWVVPTTGWTVTWQGLESAGFLVGRALTAASFAVLLILSTPWPHVLKALRVLHVPVIFIVILGMTHRYIFLFLKTAREMFEAKRSRMLARVSRRQARRIAVANLGVLLAKSLQLSNDVYLAMLARGYRGEDFTLDEFRMRAHDWAGLAVFAGLAAAAFWLGQW